VGNEEGEARNIAMRTGMNDIFLEIDYAKDIVHAASCESFTLNR
jgi:hypothetical protein